MRHCFTLHKQNFILRPATEDDLELAAAICDECVGQNLYPPEKIREAVEYRNQYFYLLQTEEDGVIGYVYFLQTDLQSIAQSSKVTPEDLAAVCPVDPKVVYRLQSIGIRKYHRSHGLAAKMLEFVLGQVKEQRAEVIYTVCWKMDQLVPLAKSLQSCAFSFLMEAKKVWYDEPELYCPYCNGRCHCDAHIYYKLLI